MDHKNSLFMALEAGKHMIMASLDLVSHKYTLCASKMVPSWPCPYIVERWRMKGTNRLPQVSLEEDYSPPKDPFLVLLPWGSGSNLNFGGISTMKASISLV